MKLGISRIPVNVGKSVNDILGLDDNLIVEETERQRLFRQGAEDTLYRIVGTDDLIRVTHFDDNTKDEISYEKGFFEERRKYAEEVGILSREFLIPFQVALAIGTKKENYEAFKKKLVDVDNVDIRLLRDLRAGIDRRKKGLKEFLGEELYNLLGVDSMGQGHSERLAHFIWDRCMVRINN